MATQAWLQWFLAAVCNFYNFILFSKMVVAVNGIKILDSYTKLLQKSEHRKFHNKPHVSQKAASSQILILFTWCYYFRLRRNEVRFTPSFHKCDFILNVIGASVCFLLFQHHTSKCLKFWKILQLLYKRWFGFTYGDS